MLKEWSGEEAEVRLVKRTPVPAMNEDEQRSLSRRSEEVDSLAGPLAI